MAAPPSGVASLRVERSVRLNRLDAAIGLEAGTLAALNPQLKGRKLEALKKLTSEEWTKRQKS